MALIDRLRQWFLGPLIAETAALTAQVVREELAEAQRTREARAKVVVTGLPPEQLRRVGALTLQEERGAAVESYVRAQRDAYDEASPQELIETLCSRDRQLLQEGRRLAEGTAGQRILREFMRACLYASEGKQIDAQGVQKALEALGAEPADLRTLRLHGSTLGPLDPPKETLDD